MTTTKSTRRSDATSSGPPASTNRIAGPPALNSAAVRLYKRVRSPALVKLRRPDQTEGGVKTSTVTFSSLTPASIVRTYAFPTGIAVQSYRTASR